MLKEPTNPHGIYI